MQVIVNQRHRRTATAGQALDEFDTEFSISGGGRRTAITMMLGVRIKADNRTKLLFDGSYVELRRPGYARWARMAEHLVAG